MLGSVVCHFIKNLAHYNVLELAEVDDIVVASDFVVDFVKLISRLLWCLPSHFFLNRHIGTPYLAVIELFVTVLINRIENRSDYVVESQTQLFDGVDALVFGHEIVSTSSFVENGSFCSIIAEIYA